MKMKMLLLIAGMSAMMSGAWAQDCANMCGQRDISCFSCHSATNGKLGSTYDCSSGTCVYVSTQCGTGCDGMASKVILPQGPIKLLNTPAGRGFTQYGWEAKKMFESLANLVMPKIYHDPVSSHKLMGLNPLKLTEVRAAVENQKTGSCMANNILASVQLHISKQ